MAVVELNAEEFRVWYPALTETRIPDELLEILFEHVCSIVGNDEKSLAPYNPDAQPPVNDRKILLYYALCHMCTLHLRGIEDQPGRIASSSQGSTSVSFDLMQSKSQSQTSQWWNQTQCGATYWAMTAKYRLGGRLYTTRKHHPWG